MRGLRAAAASLLVSAVYLRLILTQNISGKQVYGIEVVKVQHSSRRSRERRQDSQLGGGGGGGVPQPQSQTKQCNRQSVNGCTIIDGHFLKTEKKKKHDLHQANDEQRPEKVGSELEGEERRWQPMRWSRHTDELCPKDMKHREFLAKIQLLEQLWAE